MNFKEAQCPTCGGVLQVPEQLEKLTCMYCGREFKSEELLYKNMKQEEMNDTITIDDSQLLDLYNSEPLKAIEIAKELVEEDRFNYNANYILGMDAFPKLLLNHREFAAAFKRNTYEEAMDPYIIDSKQTVEYLDRACRANDKQKYQLLTTCVRNMLSNMEETIPGLAVELETKEVFILDDYKMVVALYLIPMILELHLDISDELADTIIREWISLYPKMPIRKGLYENIKNGFRKKGFCYITTAVCESQNKEDDCYELSMFRRFRDDYMLKQEDGQSMIDEYYQVAPKIVERIDQSADRDEIYKNIWNQYLKDCLVAIEEGNDVHCMKMYCQMVNDLQRTYILN